MLEDILERKQAGKPLSDNQPLYNAAKRYFGSWSKALRAAGIDSKKTGSEQMNGVSAILPPVITCLATKLRGGAFFLEMLKIVLR
jgi:hypothetical protein